MRMDPTYQRLQRERATVVTRKSCFQDCGHIQFAQWLEVKVHFASFRTGKVLLPEHTTTFMQPYLELGYRACMIHTRTTTGQNQDKRGTGPNFITKVLPNHSQGWACRGSKHDHVHARQYILEAMIRSQPRPSGKTHIRGATPCFLASNQIQGPGLQ